MVSKSLERVLEKVYSILKEEKIEWTVIGSVNLALQGIDVKPNDLDIITPAKNIKRFEGLFYKYVKGSISKKPSPAGKNFDFYELPLEIYAFPVQIIREDKKGVYDWRVKDSIVLINVNKIKIPCVTLETERMAYQRMRRYGKVELITNFLRKDRQARRNPDNKKP